MPGLSRLLWMVGLTWLLGLRAALAADLAVDHRPTIDLWPAVTVLFDPEHRLQAAQLATQAERFSPPTGTPGNFGRRDDTVWLRVPLSVIGIDAEQRVLDIDYPSLNRVDVYVIRGGRIAEEFRLGNELRVSERPMATRTHAATLTLMPGEQTLLLRVRTTSSMVLPLTLRTNESMLLKESHVHLAQGIIIGLAVCMLIYSLTHWVGLREVSFLAYALLLVGNLLFIGSYFGITGLYLWPEWPALSQRVSPLAVLAAVAAGATFMRITLDARAISISVDRALRVIQGLALVSLTLGIAGLLPYSTAQALASVGGLLVTVVVLPVGIIRTWRGDHAAGFMLLGWVFYIGGAVTTTGLLRGYFEPNTFTQYCYPLCVMAEMAAWMAVLSERVRAIHRNADRARIEGDTLRTLAHTDSLTGLPNRRGLQERLADELPRCTPQRLLAVYLLDLDGFKPVNDRYGHDVGDALLVAVGQRLRKQLRNTDVVARLGGDEFVVLAPGLHDETQANGLGQKMLAAFDATFDAAGQQCSVGLTIGYALAPHDAHSADELLKRADAAMYAGKQAGRHQLMRGGRKAAVATA